jgi:phthalate 4,5-dioxygenase reductase component
MDALDPDLAPLRVQPVEKVAADVYLFELRHPEERELPEFTAGSHVRIKVPSGLIRKYSLCNDPAERDRYVIAVKREASGRGGSVSLVDHARAGDMLDTSVPHNNFPLAKTDAGHIFIAGGIGITPFMSMMRHLRSSGAGRFRLYYCAREPQYAAFREELSAPEFRGQVKVHYDGGDPERALDLWPILEQPKGQHVYCCGPDAMMRAVRDMTGHWSSASVHFEAFSEPARKTAEDRAFRVRLARSGESIEVAVGTTILEALRANGRRAPSSCESGTCGTCRTKLLAGEADHRDLVLSEDERAGNIMICVSRAKSTELVIELT